ncbi:ABC transporter permease [Sinorhizobium meliloti]|uniref:ABC transporter permease n=1 Tax=Rhizobium meliloti TaxID=382 RepID=UPI001297AA12|nr:ABC transporter permease [Sinorhizobium meliloti]MQX38702.1 ABC transporter permease [Sinorhizobium meliloti]
MSLNNVSGAPDFPATQRPNGALRVFKSRWRDNIIYIALIAVFVIFAITLGDKGFLGTNNLLNIVRQSAIIAIVATAMVFVLAAGEIDLSVGAVAGLVSVVTAIIVATHGPFIGVGAGIATGLAVGVVNGLVTTRIGVPSFLTTLAMMGIAKGISMWISNTAAVPIVEDGFNFWFGGGDVGPVPVLLVWMLAATAVGHVLLRKTGFGRRVLATGGNPVAARYTGVDTAKIKLKVLMMTAVAASVAGLLYAGRLESGRYQLGEGDELSVIAAAVLGGNSLFGGKGAVLGAVCGALLIGIINNGLLLMGLDYSQQLIVRGIIIVLAVALSQVRKTA